jgi:hypothetical protein
MFNGKTHYKWPFSIAMLNYQRLFAWKEYWGFDSNSIQIMSEDTDESKIVKVIPQERWVYSVMCRKVIPF